MRLSKKAEALERQRKRLERTQEKIAASVQTPTSNETVGGTVTLEVALERRRKYLKTKEKSKVAKQRRLVSRPRDLN